MGTGILQHMTIEDVNGFRPEVVVIPIGSTEPHGPHLPYGTDFFTVDGACSEAVPLANERGGRVLMYPALPIGNNVNFKAFPFACRVRVRTPMHVFLDIIGALEEDGIRKIVIVNGHGGNTPTLHALLREHFERFTKDEEAHRAFVCVTGGLSFVPVDKRPRITHSSPHGGESETVSMLYFQPDLVRTEKLGDFPQRDITAAAVAEYQERLSFIKPWHRFLPASAGGETRSASRDVAEDLIPAGIEGLADFLAALSKAPWKPGFPYA